MSAHLKEYLDYYQTLIAPGYAVLVTGAWGVGKTYQVQKAIRKEDYWYVSLYGLPTVNDIHAAVIAEAHPRYTKGQGFVSTVAELAKSIWGPAAAASRISALLTPILRRRLKPCKVLIFDDLERSTIPLRELLGAINVYLEHHGFRVIVIVNDGKTEGELAFQKEKLFGQFIEVKPDIHEAYAHFTKRISCPSQRKFLSTHRDLICYIFQESQEQSLRILNHVIEDVGRLYATLDSKYLPNRKGIVELVSVFSALNIHVRVGNIRELDLCKRHETIIFYEMQKSRDSEINEPPLVACSNRHSHLALDSMVINDECLVETLIYGIYSTKSISKALEQSPNFAIVQDLPAWRIISSFDRREDHQVISAMQTVEDDLKNFRVANPGELLHIFSLRLMMAREGWVEESQEDVFNQSMYYVEEALRRNVIEPLDPNYDKRDFGRSYEGYIYWGSGEDKEFLPKLVDTVIKANNEALQRRFKIESRNILKMILSEPSRFRDEFSSTYAGQGTYRNVPILHHISPREFVEAWLSLSPQNWTDISDALNDRYSAFLHKTALSIEKGWAISVLIELEGCQDRATGPRRTRIRRIIPNSLRALRGNDAIGKV